MKQALIVLALLTLAPLAAAQDAPEPTPGTGQIVALRLRQPAPFAGLLIEQEDLVRWRLEIDSLRYRLDATAERAAAQLQVHTELATARLSAEGERRDLLTLLWSDRASELRVALEEATERAIREVWEHPVLWLAVGLAVGAAGVAIAVGALR